MSAVLFRCPFTNKSIDWGIETDERSIASLENEPVEIECPHCGKTHKFHLRDARLRDHRLAGRTRKKT